MKMFAASNDCGRAVLSNPFEDPDASYVVLVNDEGQHSLWPEYLAVPAGWEISFGPRDRASCLDHVNATWLDMRPRSLAARMDS
ncbi:MbtH family protein [Allokutzneria oryzae]|uniref:MbtH family protein n=1 Tax=Allokutzneria oryzae TaxID=1378989 RepID=A0ABV6A3H1_9PSEU